VPDVIGPYRIEARRRRGTTMTSYHAVHEAMGLPVRLAVLHDELARDAFRIREFQRHASNLALLNHPHLISGVRYGESDGKHYLAMERPEGRRLSELVESEGPFSQERALRILAQLVDAVEHVHSLGVVHGTIKSGSVLLTARDHAKLGGLGAVDLGHATFQADEEDVRPEDTEPLHISDQPVDPARDLHGLGVVLVQMLTGRLDPFTAEPRVHATREGARFPTGLPPRSLQTDLLIWRCLAPEAVSRFTSTHEVAHSLTRARQELTPAERIPAAPSATSTEPLGLGTNPIETAPLGERPDPSRREGE
jgi:serine/threonine protein kinase